MSDSAREFDELRRTFNDLPFDGACRDCRGQCCEMPWLTKEELASANQFPDAIKFIGDTAFFLNHDKCPFLDQNGKCKIYEMRPLDCRLFPLDIIEENGEYFWCVFTICPNWRKMKELFEPLLPALEKRISSSLWRQFVKQIATTKEEYPPYKNGQYVIIKKFTNPLKNHYEKPL